MNKDYEVYQLKTRFYFFLNYSYLIVDKTTGEAMLIDPAWELGKIIDKIYRLDVSLTAIALTHSHFDHVNLVSSLIKRFKPVVYMSKVEVDYYGFKCSNLHELNDLEKISLGNTKIIPLLTPGHTAGGMCYLLADSLFTGDTIFMEGCGVCNLEGGSPEQMFKSIQRVKSIVSPDIHVYPGHSYGISPGETFECLIENNVYFHIDEQEVFIDFRMREMRNSIFNFK